MVLVDPTKDHLTGFICSFRSITCAILYDGQFKNNNKSGPQWQCPCHRWKKVSVIAACYISPYLLKNLTKNYFLTFPEEYTKRQAVDHFQENVKYMTSSHFMTDSTITQKVSLLLCSLDPIAYLEARVRNVLSLQICFSCLVPCHTP